MEKETLSDSTYLRQLINDIKNPITKYEMGL